MDSFENRNYYALKIMQYSHFKGMRPCTNYIHYYYIYINFTHPEFEFFGGIGENIIPP